MDGSIGRTVALNDMEERVQDIIAEYGDLVTGEEPQVEEFKRAIQDFLEHGPWHARPAAPGLAQAYERLGPRLHSLPDDAGLSRRVEARRLPATFPSL